MAIINSIFSTTKGYNNFQMFSPTHILIILFVAILSLIVIKMKNRNKTFVTLLTTITIIDQICFYGWYFINRPVEFLQYGLFLYHCTLSILILVIGTLIKNKNLIKWGSYCGFFGGIVSVIYAGTPFYYPFPHITQISHFVMHTYLLLFSIYYLFIEKVGMSKKDYKEICLVTIIYNIFLFIFNLIFKTNYGFVSALPFDIGIYPPVIICYLLTTLTFIIVFTLEYVILNYSGIRKNIRIINKSKINPINQAKEETADN